MTEPPKIIDWDRHVAAALELSGNSGKGKVRLAQRVRVRIFTINLSKPHLMPIIVGFLTQVLSLAFMGYAFSDLSEFLAMAISVTFGLFAYLRLLARNVRIIKWVNREVSVQEHSED